MPETIAMLRGSGEDTYWRLTLQYGIDGNLQSVLDEYVHVLRESLGLQGHSPEEQVAGIAECIQSVLSLRTAQIRIDEIKKSGDGFILDDFNTRCRFALRFGDIRDDNNQALVRADSVRDAFNSPFRPFVLASTSIGQEGLDFHTWCHAVVHWNLPSNPVDLEQREGRVHRYKGHAVRKNIAERYGLTALSEAFAVGDPWQTLFRIAAQRKPNGQSDLIPYWIFEEGSARLERRIPLIPYMQGGWEAKATKTRFGPLSGWFLVNPARKICCSALARTVTIKSADLADWLISLQPPDIVFDEYTEDTDYHQG
ncbi:helicase-related protein [Vibrio sp. PP-XX7]